MSIIISISGFIGLIFIHFFYVRIFTQANRVISFVMISVVVGIIDFLILCFVENFYSYKTYAGIFLYFLLTELYLFLFTLTLSSISANLLVSLKTGVMKREEINSLYNANDMVNQRFERLASSGLLLKEGASENQDYYRITDKGTRLLHVLGALRKYFRHTL